MGDDPVEDLDAGADVDADVDDPFAEMDVEEVDEETVWEELAEEPSSDAASGTDGAGVGRPATPPEEPDAELETEADVEGNAAVVPKRSYCQRCEHFSPPPRVGCAHAGTEIVELVDVDHFRVRDCPVVERRRDARDVRDAE